MNLYDMRENDGEVVTMWVGGCGLERWLIREWRRVRGKLLIPVGVEF